MEEAARTSVALDALVDAHSLGSLAYYYKGTGTSNQEAISSIILGASLLTARGIPAAGECEVKNAQAMKIMDTLGVGGSFTEYYAVDYADDVVLMGHDGPGHIAIAEGKIRVRPLEVYHGKVGRGLSVEMSVKHGPVTLLSVVEERGRVKLLTSEAESVPVLSWRLATPTAGIDSQSVPAVSSMRGTRRGRRIIVRLESGMWPTELKSSERCLRSKLYGFANATRLFAAITGAALVASGLLGQVGYPSRAADLDVRPGFRTPPPGYGEVAFYWWLGDPLTKERLTWHLDQLQGKGVSALQVNYAHSDKGGRFWGLTYPSDPPCSQSPGGICSDGSSSRLASAAWRQA